MLSSRQVVVFCAALLALLPPAQAGRQDLLAQNCKDEIERVEARIAQDLERCSVRDIDRLPQRSAAARLDLRRDLLDERLPPSAGDNVCARVGEPQRDGSADTARAADDDGHAFAQIEEGRHRDERS